MSESSPDPEDDHDSAPPAVRRPAASESSEYQPGRSRDTGGGGESGAGESGGAAQPGRAAAEPTIVAVGTSVTWSTGNLYENKFPNLVHRDLTGSYPLEEKFLHYTQGSSPPGDATDPTPTYYTKTQQATSGGTHPNGDPLPPKQYRARGGAIIGLSRPAPVLYGDQELSDRPSTDEDAPGGGDNYLAKKADGSYYGKLDFIESTDDSIDGDEGPLGYETLFDETDINESRWLIARDIGWSWPTVVDQIQQFDKDDTRLVDVPKGTIPRFGGTVSGLAPAGNDVDIVLIDGGTNDLTLGWLNDPRKAGRQTIRQATRQYMYDDMKQLLAEARSTFPNAVIILMGEPVWASNRTDRSRAKKLLLAKSAAAAIPSIVEQAFDNVLNFSRFQAHWLRRTVAEKSRTDPGPGIVLAPPGYGIVNSMMADWPWSFGYDTSASNFDKPGITTDDVRQLRYDVCRAEYDAEHECVGGICTGADAEIGKWGCFNAPIGHPNPEGCRQYADTIIRRYKEHIDLSVADTADSLDAGTESLRDSLDRYGLGPDGDGVRSALSNTDLGVRWALSHRVIDSIRIDVTTGTAGALADGTLERGRVRLGVWPGRREAARQGDREQFVLDTEGRDFVKRDRFFIEPMMRRRLTGPVGNTDKREEKNIKTFITETSNQRVHPPGHWSDRRLRLGHLDHLTLTIDGVEPDGWAARQVSYELNGAITGTRRLGTDFDHTDIRETVRPREFQIASFNDIAGASASDLKLTSTITGFDGTIGSPATVDLRYGVRNTSDVRLPSVLLQYGWRAGGEGRDWQVAELGAIPPGQSRSTDVTLKARQVQGFRRAPIEIRAGAFVGETATWTSTTTSVSDLNDL